MEPILEVPEHIKALPEPEQGPALVEAIHIRKKPRVVEDANTEG